MFIGHYAASLVAKKADRRLPLGWLFIGAQFLDVLWALFVLLGIEKLRVDPQLPSSRYVLYYLPFTHGLITALMWSGIAFLALRYLPLLRPEWRTRAGVVMALTVFSHWVFDLLVHRPDLPLIENAHKVGFGLYNYPILSWGLESVFLIGGLWLYLRATDSAERTGRFAVLAFGGFLFLVNLFTYFGPPPPSAQAAAVFNELSYIALALMASWVDRKRAPRETTETAVPTASLSVN